MVKKEKKVWVVSTARAYGYEPHAVYDSIEQVLEQFKEDWGDEITMEDIMDYDWRRESEIEITTTTYYPSTKEIREEKINTILN